MKIKKYLSVAIGILEAMENTKHNHTADIVYSSIVQLEQYLNNKGFFYKEESCDLAPKATVHLTVVNEHKEGIIAQVKFFPMKDSDTIDTFNKLDGQINFIRSYTQPDGSLTIDLPIVKGDFTKYFLEISKGSEYEILNVEVCAKMDTPVHINQTLARIIDMQSLGWHPGDLHHHSIYSSPVHGGTDDVVESPLEVAYSMQAAGLTYGALSDHHNILNHSEWEKTKSENFTPLISKEISTSNGHVMSLNVPIDVIYDIPHGERRTEEFLRSEFIRITDQIKSLGGLAQLNHPRDLSPAISLNPKFTDMIEVFDTVEIWNGSNPMFGGTTNYAAALLWLELLEEDRFIPATTGSDTHNILANDYHKMLDKITWLIKTLKPILTTLPSELQSEATYLICLYEKTTPLLEKWAEESLGTGCVKTYVYLQENICPSAILKSLRMGNSFLTNGPILVPSIENKLPGETLEIANPKVDIGIKLISNKPLANLYLYSNNGKVHNIALSNTTSNNKYFDYSQQIKNFNTEGVKWIFFVATSDCTNLVITNPIFIKERI